jgi:hypothetical protein
VSAHIVGLILYKLMLAGVGLGLGAFVGLIIALCTGLATFSC